MASDADLLKEMTLVDGHWDCKSAVTVYSRARREAKRATAQAVVVKLVWILQRASWRLAHGYDKMPWLQAKL